MGPLSCVAVGTTRLEFCREMGGMPSFGRDANGNVHCCIVGSFGTSDQTLKSTGWWGFFPEGALNNPRNGGPQSAPGFHWLVDGGHG